MASPNNGQNISVDDRELRVREYIARQILSMVKPSDNLAVPPLEARSLLPTHLTSQIPQINTSKSIYSNLPQQPSSTSLHLQQLLLSQNQLKQQQIQQITQQRLENDKRILSNTETTGGVLVINKTQQVPPAPTAASKSDAQIVQVNATIPCLTKNLNKIEEIPQQKQPSQQKQLMETKPLVVIAKSHKPEHSQVKKMEIPISNKNNTTKKSLQQNTNKRRCQTLKPQQGSKKKQVRILRKRPPSSIEGIHDNGLFFTNFPEVPKKLKVGNLVINTNNEVAFVWQATVNFYTLCTNSQPELYQVRVEKANARTQLRLCTVSYEYICKQFLHCTYQEVIVDKNMRKKDKYKNMLMYIEAFNVRVKFNLEAKKCFNNIHVRDWLYFLVKAIFYEPYIEMNIII